MKEEGPSTITWSCRTSSAMRYTYTFFLQCQWYCQLLKSFNREDGLPRAPTPQISLDWQTRLTDKTDCLTPSRHYAMIIPYWKTLYLTTFLLHTIIDQELHLSNSDSFSSSVLLGMLENLNAEISHFLFLFRCKLSGARCKKEFTCKVSGLGSYQHCSVLKQLMIPVKHIVKMPWYSCLYFPSPVVYVAGF